MVASLITRILAIAGMLVGAQLVCAAPISCGDISVVAVPVLEVNHVVDMHKRLDIIGSVMKLVHEKALQQCRV
ncbi:hypothetical protein EUX98_g4039 [Antrodiella citrinella]|uniref:Uncharacterized protein n=1 Tax=Antrodiella citrinella TaxID=2447956 RepID=A0A4S4MUZ2_9APHY|nr:hypothetical protein EUX98_g4039 [Antrodiella citrinella]